MLGGKRQPWRSFHRNTKDDLDPSQVQTPEPKASTSQSGRQDVESRKFRGLVRPFKMLAIARSPAPRSPAIQQQQQQDNRMDPAERVKSYCRTSVLTALPDIDPECLMHLCEEAQWDPNLVIDRLLDEVENGHPYPTAPKPNLKRKREDDEDTHGPEAAAKKFDNDERRSQRKTASYLTTT